MKILFTCGSAEAGKDGVGDYYTRRVTGIIPVTVMRKGGSNLNWNINYNS